MRRPLYLDVASVKQVELEGPALRVWTHGRAAAFFPLRQVSRVVVTGKIQWETGALLACLDYGVPVAFRQRDGRLVGHCLSDRSSQTSLEALLQAAADTPEGDRLYHQWRLHEESRWLKRVAKLCGLQLRASTAHSIMPLLTPLLQAQLPCPLAMFRAQLQAPIASHVAEVLEAYGFSDNIHLPLTRRVHLSRDVEQLLLLEAYWLVLCGLTPEDGKQRGLRYSIVAFYQQRQGEFELRARVVLNRLWRLLKHQEADT